MRTFSLKSACVFFWFYVHQLAKKQKTKKLKLIALNGDHNGVPSAPTPLVFLFLVCSFYVASIVIWLFIVSSVCVCQYKYFHFHFVSHIYCLCLAPCCFVLCGVHFVCLVLHHFVFHDDVKLFLVCLVPCRCFLCVFSSLSVFCVCV